MLCAATKISFRLVLADVSMTAFCFAMQVDDSIKIVDMSIKEAAYHAWLGYYNSIADIGRDKTMLADLANRFGASIGLEKPPALYRKTALKMGLKNVPGIRIRK